MPKNWRRGWLSFASCRFDIVTVLHFAAPKRTFQEVAHFSMLHKSWFKDAAAGILSLDLMKLMSVTSSAYRMEVLDIDGARRCLILYVSLRLILLYLNKNKGNLG